MEGYGFNPNHDPTLPAVGGVTDTQMGEDQSGYRGWGTTSSNRKASTTLASGMTQSHSDNGGYHSPGSPTQATVSDGHSADPLMHKRVHGARFREHVGVRLAEVAPLRLETELLVDREVLVHETGLDLVGAVIDEQGSLPLGAEWRERIVSGAA